MSNKGCQAEKVEWQSNSSPCAREQQKGSGLGHSRWLNKELQQKMMILEGQAEHSGKNLTLGDDYNTVTGT